MAIQALGTSHISPPRADYTYKGNAGLLLPHKVGHIFWDVEANQDHVLVDSHKVSIPLMKLRWRVHPYMLFLIHLCQWTSLTLVKGKIDFPTFEFCCYFGTCIYSLILQVRIYMFLLRYTNWVSSDWKVIESSHNILFWTIIMWPENSWPASRSDNSFLPSHFVNSHLQRRYHELLPMVYLVSWLCLRCWARCWWLSKWPTGNWPLCYYVTLLLLMLGAQGTSRRAAEINFYTNKRS